MTQSNPFCTYIITSYHTTMAHSDDTIVVIYEKSMECLIENMKNDQPIFSRNWSYYFIVNKHDFSGNELIWLRSWKSYLITFLKAANNSLDFFILINLFFALFCLVRLEFRFESIFRTWNWILRLNSIFCTWT